jgi:pyrroloquinoline quinone (PQQ) biosynthesis protein C
MSTQKMQVTTNSVQKEFFERFNGAVDGLIERSSFFQQWKPGAVNNAVADKFLSNFNVLVASFPGLIALGAARAEDEDMRTVLAVNLHQECGNGDVSRTHHAIYRKYLATAGVDPNTAPPENFTNEWRSGLRDYLTGTPSSSAALGALATGEFLAPPALSRIYDVLKPMYPMADIEYFTTHLELEAEHIEEIAMLLAREVERGARPEEIIEGFEFGLDAWEKYFNNLSSYLFN